MKLSLRPEQQASPTFSQIPAFLNISLVSPWAKKSRKKMRKSGKLLFDYTSKKSFLVDNGIQCGFIMGPVNFNLCFFSHWKPCQTLLSVLRKVFPGSLACSRAPRAVSYQAKHSLWQNSLKPFVWLTSRLFSNYIQSDSSHLMFLWSSVTTWTSSLPVISYPVFFPTSCFLTSFLPASAFLPLKPLQGIFCNFR